MEQTWLESAIESSLNIASGFVVSYMVWIFVIPIWWPQYVSDHATAFAIVCIFTVTSWLRSYLWRRFFNKGLHKIVHRKVMNIGIKKNG